MKKLIVSTIMAAGLLLLASCGSQEGIGPIEVPQNNNTPTPIVVPTCTPTVTPTPDPAKVPAVTEAVEPTETPEPSATTVPDPEPTATPTVEPTVVPTEEPTPVPTATATPIPSPKPTETPAPSATEAPGPEPTATPAVEPTVVPTEEPAVTATPMPSPEPTVTMAPQETVTPIATPTPTVDPKPLVYRGWQQTVSIDDEYLIIFPEMFRDSTVEKTETELRTDYTCADDEAISFQVSYMMLKTLEDGISEIPDAEGTLLKILPEEKRAEFRYQEDGMIYRGIMVECRYARELLGDTFGEEEWITGVLLVVFTYPEEQEYDYETVIYRYFVVNNGEE